MLAFFMYVPADYIHETVARKSYPQQYIREGSDPLQIDPDINVMCEHHLKKIHCKDPIPSHSITPKKLNDLLTKKINIKQKVMER